MYSKSITVWFLASFTAFVWYVIHLERRASLLPKSLPLAGFRKQTFGHFRASFRQISRTLSTLGEGYEKVCIFLSTKHLADQIPNMQGGKCSMAHTAAHMVFPIPRFSHRSCYLNNISSG